jgi:putative membrane protein
MKKAIIAGILFPLAAFGQGMNEQRVGEPPMNQPRVGEQPSQMNSPANTGRMMNAHDREFVQKAASAGMYEVKAAQLAMEKSKDDQVKSVAQHMNTDHTAANDKLKSIAQTEGITIPQQLMPEHQRQLDKLSAMSGKEFDKEYMNQQKQAHDEAVMLFQRQTSIGQNAALKSFAEQTLPTLRMHKQMVTRGSDKM